VRRYRGRWPTRDSARRFAKEHLVYRLACPVKSSHRFITITFEGPVSLHERREAFGVVVEAALSIHTSKLLVDFSGAEFEDYDPVEGVKHAWHGSQQAFLSHLAYVLPPYAEDLASSLMRRALDIEVAIFEDRQAAAAWLMR